MLDQIKQTIKEEAPLDTKRVIEKGHGRHSSWKYTLYKAENNAITEQWEGIKYYVHVHKKTKTTKAGVTKQSRSNRYFITNSQNIQPDFYLGIRKHWNIENQLHWVKDVIHNEDNNAIKKNNAPGVFSILGTIAINISRKHLDKSITTAKIMASANIKKVIQFFRT